MTEAVKKKKPLSLRFAILVSLIAAVVFLPFTILFSVCLIPTLVAAVVDDQPFRTAWITVGAMNFTGTVPAAFTLWEMGHTVPFAFQLVLNPSTLLVAFGGAAIGWFIQRNVTPFVAGIALIRNKNRLVEIDKRQKELIKKWGPGVA